LNLHCVSVLPMFQLLIWGPTLLSLVNALLRWPRIPRWADTKLIRQRWSLWLIFWGIQSNYVYNICIVVLLLLAGTCSWA
jgi:hypothetical protein